MKICVYCKLVLLHEGPTGRCEPSCDRSMCHVDHPSPSPPKKFLPVWYVERAKNTKSWGTISKCTVLLSLGLVTLTSSSSSSSTATSSPFFILPWENVVWPFFRLSLCLFLVRSLSYLELFSNSLLELLWPPLTLSSLPSGHHENHMILHSGLKPDGPPCLATFWALSAVSNEVQPTAWLSQEPSHLSGLNS
jgi:hypothetical protein